jgi:hypothetical protein
VGSLPYTNQGLIVEYVQNEEGVVMEATRFVVSVNVLVEASSEDEASKVVQRP